MPQINSALIGDDHVNTPGRVDEARRVHEAMLEDWQRRRVHFIGFAGDWNEVPPSEQDQAWARDYLGRCAQVAPVVMIPGNHDPELSLSEFHLQSEFKYPITVVTRPDVIRVETVAGPLSVACVPFVWKAHLLAQLGPLSVEESDQRAEEELAHVFRGLGLQVAAMKLPTVALIHGKWRGSKLNEEQPNRPLGMEIPIENIGMIGAHVSCVAHIHLLQRTDWNGWPISTPSSCYYVDYGEAKHKKGYLWAEIETKRDVAPAMAGDLLTERDGEPYYEVRLEHIPTPVTPMLLIEDTYSLDELGGTWAFHCAFPDIEGADVRFRFNYSKEHEKAAKTEAKAIAASMLVAGAVNVKLDPVPIPAESARSLEIVKARTLGEQASLLWKKWDLKLSPDEERTLNDRIEEIQAECGFGQRLTLDAGIHVKSTRMKGWRCFPNEVNLDFDAIDGQVIAISGPNGAGKSLAFEIMIPGALFRELPTHGKTPGVSGILGDHAIARDAFVETNFEYDGKGYTVAQIADGQSGAGSTSLKTGTTPVFGTETALRTQYDKWASENLPPLSLVTSTTFMPQESKGILGMGATARKSLILKAKGVERYEVLAEAARKRSAAVSKELDKVRARIEELGTGQTVAFCEQALAKAVDGKRVADETLRLGDLTLKDLQDKNAATEKKRTEYNALILRRTDLESQETKLRERIADLDERIKNNSDLLGRADEIRAAVIRSAQLSTLDERLAESEQLRATLGEENTFLAELDEKMSQFEAIAADADDVRKAVTETAAHQAVLKTKQDEAGVHRVRAVELEGELQAVRARINGNAQTGSELQRRIDAASLVVGTDGYLKAQALAAVESVKTLEAEIARKEMTQDQYWTEIEALQGTVSTSKDKRIKNFQDPLELIAERKVDDPATTAAAALSTNEDLESEAEEVPARLVEAKKQWAQIGTELRDVCATLAIEQKIATTLADIEAAEKTIVESQAALDVSTALYHSLIDESNAIIEKQDALTTESEQTQSDIRWLNEQIAGLEPLVGKAEALAQVEAVSIEVEKQKIRCASEIERLTNEITKIETGIGRPANKTDDDLREEKASVDKTAKFKAPLDEAETKIAAYRIERETVAADREGVLESLSKVITEAVDLPPLLPLSDHETAVSQARSAASGCQSTLVLAEKALETATVQETRRQELAASVRDLAKDTDRWNLIERTCGRDGLIAESVAAAGDEINEGANALLRASGNTKYTVDLKTTRMTKDGREVEGCPINVYNSETGEWQEGSTLSPGQRAFVNLPVGLTLAEIGCKDSTVKPTIFLDEPTAGLDPIMRIQFVAMMRDVAQRLDAKIFFVSHNEELAALADARIRIEAGAISIN